jgi:4-hydroxy-4-methyl-2-oxoglutarate aldolase
VCSLTLLHAAVEKEAMDQSLADRLEVGYSGAVYDVLRKMGFANQVLPSTIRPLLLERKLAGPVFSIRGKVKEGLDSHETLLQWTEMLSKAPSGSVVICQPNDTKAAYMGELSSETMHSRGVRGFIAEGGCRDSEFITRLGFPVFCTHYTPIDIVGRWIPEELGGEIEIGGVSIRSGDYVMADRDGIVIIPQEMVEQVVDETEVVLKTESLVRKAIMEGTDPQEAYLKYGKF